MRYNRLIAILNCTVKFSRQSNFELVNDILEILNNKDLLQSIITSKKREIKVNLLSGDYIIIKFKDNE